MFPSREVMTNPSANGFFGENLNYDNCPFSKHFKNYLGFRKDAGTEEEAGLRSITKFCASLWNMSRDKAASRSSMGA